MPTHAAHTCIVILGPTASGKTGYSLHLAQQKRKLSFLETAQAEIISADSRQVYTGLDIGTGKVTQAEMHDIPHHMLDCSDARTEVYSAHRYAVEARKIMEEIWERGNIPIVCGGTGLYIDALFGRVALGIAERDPHLRAELEQKTCAELFALLETEDPTRAANIASKGEQTNKVRLVRALEIAHDKNTFEHPDREKLLSKKSSGRQQPQPDCFLENFSLSGTTNIPIASNNILWLGLRPSPTELRANIQKRLLERLENGMLKEVTHLHASGLSWERMHTLGLEYRYCAEHLQGRLSFDDLCTILEQKIWQYSRRQINYWKRNADIQWFHPSEIEKLDAAVADFCSHSL
jgi:tRNA dimethylallyltransferase